VKGEKMRLNITYSTDENYAAHMSASILSLLEKNGEFSEIYIYVIEDNLKIETKNKLNEMVGAFDNAKIVFYPFSKLAKLSKINDKTGYAKVGYARLFLSGLCDVDKIIYIDCDTIVNDSLIELASIDISDYYVAAVQDNPAVYMSKAVGMTNLDRYINSGVLYINLKKWREDNIEQKFLDFIGQFKGQVPHHDQGILNGVLKDKILILHPKFNCMPQFFYYTEKQIKRLFKIKNYYTQKELDEAVKNPVIVHFISKFYGRPWMLGCTHPLKELYINAISKTPWNLKLEKSKMRMGVKIRKFVFFKMPFFIYLMLESFLDIKRKINLKKNFFIPFKI